MSTIFELYGYPLSDNSPEAIANRQQAWCPFMNAPCDGGGNRYSTQIELHKEEHQQLRNLFSNFKNVIPGVCSLDIGNDVSPWIVCPRRLLALGRKSTSTGESHYQRSLETNLMQLLSYAPRTRLGIWREVKIHYAGQQQGIHKEFDYTFDYVLMPVVNIPIGEIMATTNPDPTQVNNRLKALERYGLRAIYDPKVSGGYLIQDYPIGKPTIIEIMTSSTSGGDKKKRTQIGQAFEDAMLNRPHQGPGINYRQVWARMVSQLLVKSEAAIGWGGVALWIVQDVLVAYISKSTGLNLEAFKNEQLNEVNLISLSYGQDYTSSKRGVIDLKTQQLYTGKIAGESHVASGGFIDIARLPIQPPKMKLVETLEKIYRKATFVDV